MDSLPSFKSLLADIAPDVPVANPVHYHLSAAAGGASPFFSTSASSFFSSSSSSSSSFFSSSGELSGLLGARSPSSRPGKESPITAPSSPCQPSLGAILSSRLTTTTTITHHHTTLAAAAPTMPSTAGSRVISHHQQLLPLAPSLPESMFPAGVRPPVSGSPGVSLEQSRASKDLARKTSPAMPLVRVCTMCGTTKTKQWRSGSDGRPSLCNACGLRYRKDSLGQKFKFKQVVIFPSGYPSKKRKATKAREDKDKVDSVDEKELTASLCEAKARSPKRQRGSPVEADGKNQPAESGDQKKSSIYALLN